MFSVLSSQFLQTKALEAAAKAALAPAHYNVFLAVMSSIESAQSPRNRLAHWIWGVCRQRPEFLALADPKMIKERDLRVTKRLFEGALDMERDVELYQFDPAYVFAYSKSDLEKAKADLNEAHSILFNFEFYLNPQFFRQPAMRTFLHADLEHVRGLVLGLLNEKRLFREALARISADQKIAHAALAISA
jgi:hypothetical protein